MLSARAYLITVLTGCAAFLLPVGVLNLQLAANNLAPGKARLAADWQRERGGVTYAPPLTRNRPFKTLRLLDRLPEIDTVVFGSSTAMGITAAAFPSSVALYNFAQSGNGLGAVIGEAEYVVQQWGARIRRLVIPLDWALGFVFEEAAPGAIELTAAAAAREEAAQALPLGESLRDALSLPRVVELGRIMAAVMRAPEPLQSFRQALFAPAGDEYRCDDGTLARDFDVLLRGRCVGFRFDGSATFADQKRVMPAGAAAVLAAAVSPQSQYAAALHMTGGRPSSRTLERLAALAQRVRATGGEVIFFMPPLLPGVEAGLARAPSTRASFALMKASLAEWAKRESLELLDAGSAEESGCLATEFIDAHHALPGCYEKVFGRLLGRRAAAHADRDPVRP